MNNCGDMNAIECSMINMSSDSPWACVLITLLIVAGAVGFFYVTGKD